MYFSQDDDRLCGLQWGGTGKGTLLISYTYGINANASL